MFKLVFWQPIFFFAKGFRSKRTTIHERLKTIGIDQTAKYVGVEMPRFVVRADGASFYFSKQSDVCSEKIIKYNFALLQLTLHPRFHTVISFIMFNFIMQSLKLLVRSYLSLYNVTHHMIVKVTAMMSKARFTLVVKS